MVVRPARALAALIPVLALLPAAPAAPAAVPAAAWADPCAADGRWSGVPVEQVRGEIEARQRLGPLTAQHRSARSEAGGPAGMIHPAQGASFRARKGSDGACATHTVQPGLTPARRTTTIYSPTLYPPGGSCVELVTAYYGPVRAVAAWDWCGAAAFRAFVPIDGAFLATYTGSGGRYTGRVVRTDAADNTWTAALYNRRSGAWDHLFSSSGTSRSGRTTGWDVDEVYSAVTGGVADACADRRGLRFAATGIHLRRRGAWAPASAASADARYDRPDAAFHCPGRAFARRDWTRWRALG
ncbi:hypothetical protein GCM10010123_15830 [Pilimelia anulata]|uniref:Carbohydrate-binding protein n=1 Tax=Pilimelia anulata TaxID=53371 RepID=A0A8J3F8A8_9ACTN|nr:hypothetical protein [Pilimelia anulata]GGJ87060.1 hypothetical protein GCM10010123_15830 [Pilimelia anulata]